MAAATKPALSLKGTGIVFVGSRGADIKGPSRRGAGVYAWDTRHVSSYEVRPTAGSLRLRSAEILPDGALLRYSLGPLQISRRIRVENSIEDQWSIENAGPGDATFEADITVDADFRDLFEVRRRKRITKGHREPAAANGHRLLFRYTAADGVKQSTEVLAPVDAWQTGDGPARGRVAVRVAPGDRRSIEIDIRVHSTLPSPVVADRDWDAWQRTSTKFASDSSDLDAWIARSSLDLFMLSDQTPDGFFPSAGIPWFVAPFGRDSIMTALMALPLRRDLAPAVPRRLSHNQAARRVPDRGGRGAGVRDRGDALARRGRRETRSRMVCRARRPRGKDPHKIRARVLDTEPVLLCAGARRTQASRPRHRLEPRARALGR